MYRIVKKIIILLLLITIINVDKYCVKALENTGKISTPTDITCIRKSNNSLAISWKKDKSVDGYYIYRLDYKTKKYKKIKTLKSGKSSFLDRKLKTNRVYKYKVSSFSKKNGKVLSSPKSMQVSAMPYKRHDKVINGRMPKLSNDTIYLSFCSAKKIKAKIEASRFGLNKKKKPFSSKVRWYSENKEIATVDKRGIIRAKKTVGSCYVYAVAHNGRKNRVFVSVKNYANPKSFYNYGEQEDVYSLIKDFGPRIKNIAEYYCKKRISDKEQIKYSLNESAIIEVLPRDTEYNDVKSDINDLLTNYPYDIEIEITSEYVMYIIKNKVFPLPTYVLFSFDKSGSDTPEIQIASHWTMWRPIAD